MKCSIITLAKKHSERLPGKNMRVLAGKPLIDHTLDFIADTFNVQEKNCWLISDCPEMIKRAAARGINQLLEPEKYAKNGHEIGMELMRWIHSVIKADMYVMLSPTCPIRDKTAVRIMITHFMNTGLKSGFTITAKKRGCYEVNGNVFLFRSEQLFAPENDIIGEEPMLYNEDRKNNFDIDTEKDFQAVEKFLEEENSVH